MQLTVQLESSEGQLQAQVCFFYFLLKQKLKFFFV